MRPKGTPVQLTATRRYAMQMETGLVRPKGSRTLRAVNPELTRPVSLNEYNRGRAPQPTTWMNGPVGIMADLDTPE